MSLNLMHIVVNEVYEDWTYCSDMNNSLAWLYVHMPNFRSEE